MVSMQSIIARKNPSRHFRLEVWCRIYSFTSATRDNPAVAEKDKSQIDPKCDVRNKTLFVGENAFALADLGPSPLDSRSPLPYVHLNVINNVLKGDYPQVCAVGGGSLRVGCSSLGARFFG